MRRSVERPSGLGNYPLSRATPREPTTAFCEPPSTKLTYDKVRIGNNVTTLLPGNFLRFMARLRSIANPVRIRTAIAIVHPVTRGRVFPKLLQIFIRIGFYLYVVDQIALLSWKGSYFLYSMMFV